MRIKSKFELNFVHVAVLAVCPFMLMAKNFQTGMTLMLLSITSFLLATLFTLIFCKKSSKNTRIFASAIIAALVVAGFEFLAKNGTFNSIGEVSYFAILSTMILCIDSVYVDKKASTTSYILTMIRLVAIYVIVSTIYFLLKEFLSFGTIGGMKIIASFEGYAFFEMITFDLILLGLLCALINRISALFIEMHNEKTMVYNKYKMKVRNEKMFIYEHYRRKKLLTSDVEINKINDSASEEDVDTIKEDSDPNEDESKAGDEIEEKQPSEKKSEIKNKPRKKNKLKVSKEAKVEKVFDRSAGNKEGDGNA